jgi:hypothetical protein
MLPGGDCWLQPVVKSNSPSKEKAAAFIILSSGLLRQPVTHLRGAR